MHKLSIGHLSVFWLVVLMEVAVIDLNGIGEQYHLLPLMRLGRAALLLTIHNIQDVPYKTNVSS